MVERPKCALHINTDKSQTTFQYQTTESYGLCKEKKGNFSYTRRTCVVHGVGQQVRSLGAQCEPSDRVTVAVHIVDQLVLSQVPHLLETNNSS